MNRTDDVSAATENAVGYRIQVSTFADDDGDGIGDVGGLINHLGYVELLGANVLAVDTPETTLQEVVAAHNLTLAQPPDELLLAQVAFVAEAIQQTITFGSQAAEPEWSIGRQSGLAPAARLQPPGADVASGRQAAMALLLVALALPGTVWLNQGDEVALPGVDDLVPLPWEDPGPYGLTLDAELDDPASYLNLVRLAIQTRQTHSACVGSILAWYGAPQGCLAFRRDPGGLICALNTSADTVDAPPGRVLLTSADCETGSLAPYSTAWLVVD